MKMLQFIVSVLLCFNFFNTQTASLSSALSTLSTSLATLAENLTVSQQKSSVAIPKTLVDSAGMSPLGKNMIYRKDFFKYIVGYDERQLIPINKWGDFLFEQAPENCIELNGDGKIVGIKNLQNSRIFAMGEFKEYSIAQLRTASNGKVKSGNGSLHIIEAQNPSGTPYLSKVDVGAMQADPVFNDAVFQIASNFNGLELTSNQDNMGDITRYVFDYTQGPFASISAAPGLFLRHYYMFYDPKIPSAQWKQTPSHQLNFLDQTDIPVTNSYVDFSIKNPDLVSNYPVDKIKVGVHTDIEVTFGFMPTTASFEEVNNPNQKINQVFTAAVDFGSNSSFKKNEKALAIAQTVLNAAYEGTIRTAIVLDKKKVVLTLVGGGVFNNSINSIYKAIALNKDLIKDYGLDVTVIIFDSSLYSTNDIKPFVDLVKTIGGASSYIQYTRLKPMGEKLL
jgi:hypothetical protein